MLAPPRPGASGASSRLGQVSLAALLACCLSSVAWFTQLRPHRSARTCASSNALTIDSLSGDGGSGDGGAPELLVIVASHRDDVAWVHRAVAASGNSSRQGAAATRALIYEMSDGGGGEEEDGGEDDGGGGGGSVQVRHLASDRGHEAAAFLSAIVDEYDRLPAAAVVAFLHSHSTSWHSRLPGAWVLRSLLDRPPAAARLPPGGYLGTQCRPPEGEYNFRLLPANVSANPRRERPGASYVAQAWKEYFGKHLGKLPPLLAGPCCAEFIASAAAIRRRPRSFYAGAARWLEATKLEPKQAARALEYLWHLLFTGEPQLQVPEEQCLCALYGMPALPTSSARLLLLLGVPGAALAAAHLPGLWRRRRRRARRPPEATEAARLPDV